ncbi:hypothetical protein ACFVVA_34850 [Kitasatospora sp. NPDC058048]|uniref:hypothetical protein n=1 Tax=Kitasatospora sp. NPDC058048 TaxID=3346313 RepID=UPI0036DE9C54
MSGWVTLEGVAARLAAAGSTERRERLLVAAARAAEALRLERVDIEWAIDFDDRLHLVQARPLTAPLTDITTATQAKLADEQVLHGIAAAPGAPPPGPPSYPPAPISPPAC